MSKSRRALVLGGTGFFGSRLVRDLLDHTDLEITTVSRRKRGLDTTSTRLSHITADIRDQSALRGVTESHDLVLHAAGPFENMCLQPLVAAIGTRHRLHRHLRKPTFSQRAHREVRPNRRCRDPSDERFFGCPGDERTLRETHRSGSNSLRLLAEF
jgi:hypothetical protein